MSEAAQKVRLLFVDAGTYHHEEISIPARLLDGYDRLIDCIREDPELLADIYVDFDRLCAAYRVNGDQGGSGPG